MQLRFPFDDLPARTWTIGSLWRVAWIPALVAFVVYAPVLWHSFLSDDEVILNYIFRQDIDTPELNWDVIAGDFSGSWLGLKHAGYYRPFINISFALSYLFGGLSPVHYYLHNLLLHMLASVACGLLCALVVRSRPQLSLIVGGVLFALHPAGHEVVCWISARNSGMDVGFRMLSMCCFAAAIRPRGGDESSIRAIRWSHGGAVAFAWLALICKETALALAVCYVALDVLITPQRSLRDRIRLHLMYGLVWLSYLFVRWMMIGMDFGKMPVGQGEAYIWTVWEGIKQRVETFLWPRATYDALGQIAGGVILAAFAAIFVWAVRDKKRLIWIVLGCLWAFVISIPNMSLPVEENLAGSRYLYASVGVLIVILCRITIGQQDLSPKSRRFLLIVFLVPLLPMWFIDLQKITHYRISSDHRRVLQARFDEEAKDSTEQKPMALVSVDRPVHNVPFVNLNSLFTVSELPFAKRNTPFVALTTATRGFDLSGMAFDMEPVRAVHEMGGKIYLYHDMGDGLQFMPFGSRKPTVVPKLMRKAPNRFEFVGGGTVSLFQVEGLKIYLPSSAKAPKVGKLRWVQYDGKLIDGYEYEFTGPQVEEEEADRVVYEADLRKHPVLRLELGGKLKGVEIVWDGVEASGVEVVTRVPMLQLARYYRGRRTNLKDLGPALMVPKIPDELVGRKDYKLHLVFMNGAYALLGGGIDGIVRAGEAVVLPTRAERLIEGMSKLMRVDRFYYYFTLRGPGIGARSEVDWVTIDVRPEAPQRRDR